MKKILSEIFSLKTLYVAFCCFLFYLLVLAVTRSSYGFTNKATKAIYPVSYTHRRQKTVYGIYSKNQYWAITKKPKITKLTKTVIKKVFCPPVMPYHVKLFMRFNNEQ